MHKDPAKDGLGRSLFVRVFLAQAIIFPTVASPSAQHGAASRNNVADARLAKQSRRNQSQDSRVSTIEPTTPGTYETLLRTGRSETLTSKFRDCHGGAGDSRSSAEGPGQLARCGASCAKQWFPGLKLQPVTVCFTAVHSRDSG